MLRCQQSTLHALPAVDIYAHYSSKQDDWDHYSRESDNFHQRKLAVNTS